MMVRSTPANSPDWLVARPIAHRGLHDAAGGRLENTRSAFQAAMDHGFAIECDLQRAGDGEAVVFHDFRLDRLTNDARRIDELDAAELARLPLKGTDERIETFEALLSQVAGRAPVVAEIKSRFDGDLRLVERAVSVAAGFPGTPIAFKSFDPKITAALRRLAPALPRGIIAMGAYNYPDYTALSPAEKYALANMLHFTDTEPDFLSWHVGDLPSAVPYLFRNGLGLPVVTWTVRSPDQAALAREHADQMVFEGFLP